MQTPVSHVTLFLIVTTVIILLLIIVIIALMALYQNRQQAFHTNLTTLKTDFEKSSLQTQVEVQEQTFQNISREIHDNINLSLTLAKLNLNTLDWQDIAATRESVKASVDMLGHTIADLSNLSKSTNTELITEMGLLRTLKNEVERVGRLARIPVEIIVKGDPVFMESEKELILFRIIQEALNNAIKHANASRIGIGLNYKPTCLEVTITDNGYGFNKEESLNHCLNGKSGLMNMHTRTKMFGGMLSINSKTIGGTEIKITIPY